MNGQQHKEAIRHGIADAIMGADNSPGVCNNYGPEYARAYLKGQQDYETAQVVNRQVDQMEAALCSG